MTAAARPLLLPTVVWLASMLTGGCQIFPRTLPTSPQPGWEHSNLYNSAAPHRKLFVEIDAVEGQGPTRDELQALEDFLGAHCAKPDGIAFSIDNIIPQRRVAGRTAEMLAAEYADGPRDADAAFLYILFYNSRLQEKSAFVEAPAFASQPFPIIYINRAYRVLGNPFGRTFARVVLQHETGHALGLCAAASHHGEAGHCKNAACMMYSSLTFSIRRFLTFRNPWRNTELCADCLADLERNKAGPANPKLDFWHGFLRRRELGYQVLETPGLIYVRFGEPLSAPSDRLVQAQNEAAQDIARRTDSVWWVQAETFDPFQHLEAFTRLAGENVDTLRRMVDEIFKSLAQQLDQMAESEPDAALDLLTDQFIASANAFPDHQARLAALREVLACAAVMRGEP